MVSVMGIAIAKIIFICPVGTGLPASSGQLHLRLVRKKVLLYPYRVFLYSVIGYFGGFLYRGGIQRSFIGVGCLGRRGWFLRLGRLGRRLRRVRRQGHRSCGVLR